MNTKLLKQILKENNITQRELSQRTGISTTSLNQILLNYVKPRTETIEKIAAALGISVATLMAQPAGPVHIQSGTINNIMGNNNGLNDPRTGGTLFYGTGEIELLKNEVASLRELLQSKDQTIESLKMLIEHYKKGEG